jgi:anti-sigma factor RsiW
MSDCVNVEIRELLPELLHGKLSPAEQARVEAHVAACDDCASELAVLRSVQSLFARVPKVDTASIVKALPAPPRARVMPRRRMMQIAAALTFVSLGGISLAVVRSSLGTGNPSDTGIAHETAVAVAPSTGELTFAGGVADLADEDLESLLSSLDAIEAVPSSEPDPQAGLGDPRSGGDTTGSGL